jgi:hypothetical protein
MSTDHTIGFLHTALANEVTFGTLMQSHPDIRSVHRTRVDLLDRARTDLDDQLMLSELRAELTKMANEADVLVCTCSTLGALAEAVSSQASILRVDRPMVRLAVQNADRIDVIVAVESTVQPTLKLFLEEAQRQGRSPVIAIQPLFEAWPAWCAGDVEAYSHMIARHADELLGSNPAPDLVVLGQSSMLGALSKVADPSRVLCSPVLAIDEAIRILLAG